MCCYEVRNCIDGGDEGGFEASDAPGGMNEQFTVLRPERRDSARPS
jgi:hypothetical protein